MNSNSPQFCVSVGTFIRRSIGLNIYFFHRRVLDLYIEEVEKFDWFFPKEDPHEKRLSKIKFAFSCCFAWTKLLKLDTVNANILTLFSGMFWSSSIRSFRFRCIRYDIHFEIECSSQLLSDICSYSYCMIFSICFSLLQPLLPLSIEDYLQI